MEAINAALQNSIQGGTKADSISDHRRRHDTNLNSEQVPYEAWHLLHHPWGRSICHILCSLAGDCCTSTSTQAERVFSWMGFLLNKRRLSLSGTWERHHAALPEGQPGDLSRCLFDSKMRWQYIMVPTRIASKLICFPGDIFVLIGFVIIGG